MTTNVSDRVDEFDNLNAQGIDATQQSRIVARVLFQDPNVIQYAADIWGDGDAGTGVVQFGFFAYGIATSQTDIDQLTASETTLTFTGPMSVDNSTVADITMQYNADPSWTGSWSNPSYNFTAGGPVNGADFVSVSEQFSDNVQSGFVQGALLGPGSDPAVAHLVEVNLDGTGLVRDVGLLRPAAP